MLLIGHAEAAVLASRMISEEEYRFVSGILEELQQGKYPEAGEAAPLHILRRNSARRTYLNLAGKSLHAMKIRNPEPLRKSRLSDRGKSHLLPRLLNCIRIINTAFRRAARSSRLFWSRWQMIRSDISPRNGETWDRDTVRVTSMRYHRKAVGNMWRRYRNSCGN